MKRYVLITSLSILLIGGLGVAHETNAIASMERVRFTPEAIMRGYTADYNKTAHSAWGDLRVGILPNLVNEEINLEMKQFNGDGLADPEGMTRVSDYYIYDILRKDQATKEALVLNKPFYLAMRFESANLWRKRIFFWTGTSEGWRALPSSIDYENGYVRAITHLPFSRIAVFEDQHGTEGHASWYRSSRYAYGAASNDFPIGTKLRVRNVDNGRIVDVTVQSTGPFTPFAWRRVVDLTYDAFSAIESPGEGTARVQVWNISESGTVMGAHTTATAQPRVSSSAVIAIDEKTEDILYSKNFDTILPLASITKLMTAMVFLDTHTSFDTEVTYTADDNAIGAKLYVNPGETMSVKDLWYTMLVGSANNAAKALARSTGLSTEEFVARMNTKAKALGLHNTHFSDVTGLDTRNVSTVYDIARLAKHAFNDFRIMQATSTWTYGFRTINTNQGHTIKNTATGMTDSPYVLTGMKTGYLDEAGYCFVVRSAKNRDADRVIIVVLGARSGSQRWDETNQLMNYGSSQL